MNKVAMISGARGQAASHMADLLLRKGYTVVAFERQSGSERDYSNIEHLLDDPKYILEIADILDFASLVSLLDKYHPDEFYNFAALSHVHQSFSQPLITCESNFTSVANILEAIRLISPETRMYHSSTSEVYGDVQVDQQDESSEIRPRSPYGAAKAGSESLVKVYRDAYGLYTMYTRNFNFEGTRRGKRFVTRKITDWIGQSIGKCKKRSGDNLNGTPLVEYLETAIRHKIIQPLRLGNLDARRDWSDCRDTVRAIWMAMQEETPDCYVVGSGTTRSIRDFLDAAFHAVNIKDWSNLVEIDPKFYRPADVNLLCADPTKIKTKLGWEPEINFEQMVKEMVENDVNMYLNRVNTSRV